MISFCCSNPKSESWSGSYFALGESEYVEMFGRNGDNWS